MKVKKIPEKLKEEIKEKMKNCDLVIVGRKGLLSKLEVWLFRLIFPEIEDNPLAPVFGYKGKIYGEEGNLMNILLKREYKNVCVIKHKLPWNRKRWKDVVKCAKESEEWKIFIKFVIVGISGIIVNLLFFFFFYQIMKIEDMISLPSAIEISIIATFFLNDRWVFVAKKYKNTIIERFVLYHLILLLGMVINILVYYPFSLIGLNYLIADGFGIAVASLWSFYMNNVYVFARKVKK